MIPNYHRSIVTVQMRPPCDVLMAGQRHVYARRLATANAPDVRVGAAGTMGTSVVVRAGGVVDTTAASLFYLAYAGGLAFLSFSLFTGRYLFKTAHPVWGSVAALFALGGLWSAGDRLKNSGA